jgi:replicative DNA helicase
MLKDGTPCLYCPTEMRPAQFMDRMAPLLVNVPADKFRSRDFDLNDLENISNIQSQVEGFPLTLLNIASPNIHEIKMAVKSSGCKVLFLDYLGRCSMPKENTRMREIERFVVDLKNICVDMGILCFLAVQLSRATDYNKDSEPRLADLSDSSAIEKEADAVIFLWRDPANPGSYDMSNISGVLGKNRHGVLDRFSISFIKRQMRMTDQHYTPKEKDYNEPQQDSF